MAKLSARGRKELFRLSKERLVEDDQLIDWKRITCASMSDNRLLTKLDVHFKETQHLQAYRHSFGWKVKCKLKNPTAVKNRLLSLGYIEV